MKAAIVPEGRGADTDCALREAVGLVEDGALRQQFCDRGWRAWSGSLVAEMSDCQTVCPQDGARSRNSRDCWRPVSHPVSVSVRHLLHAGCPKVTKGASVEHHEERR